jgi:Uma2 family endonuclease
MPPNIVHQRLARFLVRLLSWYVEYFELGEVVIAPFEMLLEPGRVAREPDVLFIAKAHLWRITPQRINGPADLAIEIVSHSSVIRDHRDKLKEYEAAGVREYWLLDARSDKHRARFHQLGPTGRYQTILPDATGRYDSLALDGFWLNISWLWQDPLPRPGDLQDLILGGRRSSSTTP